MKPTSIIFIIVSVVLIIAGFITMGIASRMALPDDVALVPSRAGNVRTDSFAESDVNFINIDVKNANVEIIGCYENSAVTSEDGGRADSVGTPSTAIPVGASKIELYNFTEGFYDYSCSGKTLAVSDNYDMDSFSGVLSFIMNFKGLRNYIYYHETSELEKTVRIYVSEDVNVTCSVKEGNVTMTDVGSAANYVINVGKGEVTVNGTHLSTDENTGLPLDPGALSISVEKGDVTVNDVDFETYYVKFGKESSGAYDKDQSEGGLPIYARSDTLDCGKDHNIGEYYATTGHGTLSTKNDTALDCTVQIKYDSAEGGIKSAVPNAAGTKFTVSENGGAYVEFKFESRNGSEAKTESQDESQAAA